MKWLFVFAFIVAFLIVFGGFVRLTRSGLSIVEWNPISGALPPMDQQAWQDEFAKYRATPEYIKINSAMTLEEYRYFFYVEWIHRNLARLSGVVYLAVFYFLYNRSIPFKEFGIYLAIGLTFIAQAFAGWYMVASGLVDRPSVSHFNLTMHLLLALALLGLTLWTALGHKYSFLEPSQKVKWSLPSLLALVSFIALIIQMAYGGFTAGLKAGHVSDTWPLMFGALIPLNLSNSFLGLFETPQTIVFIHRWFAWMCLILTVMVFYVAKKHDFPADLQSGLKWLIGAVTLQIVLGVMTILSHVNILIALAHQANAIMLFALMIFFIHRFRALDQE